MINILLLLGLFFITTPSLAQNDQEKGLQIIEEMVKRDKGWQDSQAEMKMILRTRSGSEAVRLLRINTLEVTGDGDKSLTIFDSPGDVRGTAFLSYTHALEPDDQWLYLPALRRVRRISSNNKSGPFLGSEFAFEDLTSFEIPKYQYRYLRDEAVDGIDCFVVELDPQYEHSGYTRQISWIEKERYIPIKVEYYDRRNALLKTLENKDYRQHLDQYWRAHDMLMTNHQNGKSTSLLIESIEFRTGLTERDFDQNTLKRAR